MEIKDILLSDETLFRDEGVFTPNYVPEDFIHRDPELKELALSLKPGLRGVNPINTLIHGPPGTGKTTAIRYLFNQVRGVSGKLLTVYINCEDASTPYSIFARIYEALYGFSPPSTGKPLEDLKERVYTKLKKEDKSIVVALDELDRLFLNKRVEDTLIDLLKAHATYDYDRLGVIGVIINPGYMAYLSEKSRSVYNPVYIHFRPYSPGELRDIIGNRVGCGFYPDVVPEAILDSVVDYTYRLGDLRFGIDLLRRSAILAERDSSRSLEERHLEEVVSKSGMRMDKISGDGRALLEVIGGNEGKTSGDIYKLFRVGRGVGVKKYNQLVKELEYAGLIKGTYLTGRRGRSRTLKLVKE